MPKREVCPMCKGCGHILVLNWPEHCPKCKRTGFVPASKPVAPGVRVPAQCKHCKLRCGAWCPVKGTGGCEPDGVTPTVGGKA